VRKLLQNKIAESKLTMPAITLYALGVWLLAGMLTNYWWWQLACFTISSYLVVELNNINALIRIFSRMVSGAFIALLCCASFLFPHLPEAVMLTCLTAFTVLFFLTYQNKESAGITYYAFLLFGVASMAYVHVLFFLPLIWLMMLTNIMSLSWRTWLASLFGLLTPYWFAVAWLFYQHDYSLAIEHFSALAVFEEPLNLYGITAGQKATLALVILMAIIGTIHFIRKNYLDKIRIRMFYGYFMWMDLAALVFLLLQPQHFNAMLLIMILNTSPLIAHFVALTSTKLTNIVFWALTTATLLLTAYNLWISSSLF
jgi:hypothetical protein